MPLISLHQAAEVKFGKVSEIRDNPKRLGNWLWERVRAAEARRTAGIARDPKNPWDWFPARRDGKKWVVDTQALDEWYRRFFQTVAA